VVRGSGVGGRVARVGGKGSWFPAISAMILGLVSHCCRWWGTAEGAADV